MAFSTRVQVHTSISFGPRGFHTLKVLVPYRYEQFGKMPAFQCPMYSLARQSPSLAATSGCFSAA